MDISRLLIVLLVLVSSGSIAVGCGDDDGGDTTSDSESTTSTSVGDDVPSISDARTINLPGPTVFPEGIAIDKAGERMFVSSTTDGSVYVGPVDGAALAPVQPKDGGPTTAVGLATGPGDTLWVAGGDTGMAWQLDQAGGVVRGSHKAPGSGATFINDVAVAGDGTAYLTDSMRPVIWRVAADAAPNAPLEQFVDLSTGPITYEDGFNLNGIELTPDQEHLLVVQSNTGGLFKVPVAGGEPVAVDLGDEQLVGGDGLELDGERLYVVLGDAGEVAVVDLDTQLESGEIVTTLTDDSFARPTTIATEGDVAYVVNSQFDKMDAPTLPFTVSALTLGTDS